MFYEVHVIWSLGFVSTRLLARSRDGPIVHICVSFSLPISLAPSCAPSSRQARVEFCISSGGGVAGIIPLVVSFRKYRSDTPRPVSKKNDRDGEPQSEKERERENVRPCYGRENYPFDRLGARRSAIYLCVDFSMYIYSTLMYIHIWRRTYDIYRGKRIYIPFSVL